MKRLGSSRAGQLSFDMAFAIVAVAMVSGMLLEYFNISVWSHEDARRMFALNVVGDYTASRLNSFYTSLIGASGNATLSMDLPEKYLAGSPDNDYGIGYTVNISAPAASNAKFTFKSQEDPLLSTSRQMGFAIECNPSSPMPASVAQGGRIRLQECTILSTRRLKCEKCS